MKKCPNCQKEFPDSMRFCQTDGTPLVESVAESQPEDPLKTTVVRQEDIASAIPPSDPFKTMVASSISSDKDESGDLLQLPEQEFDPLKTMVASPIRPEKPIFEEPKPEPPRFEDIRQEIKSESSPYSGFAQPNEPLPEAPKDYADEPTELQPEPPKFNEPQVAPPAFGGSSYAKEEDDLPQTVMQNPWDNAASSEKSPYVNDSPFSKPSDAPASSPFDMSTPFEMPKSAVDEPQSPFNQPASPFDAPQSFDQPKPSGFNPPPASFDNQPASFDQPKTSFDEPAANQFGAAQFDQMNQGFGGADQQLQQNEWNAPPAPESGWGEQGIGANTPFQPPVAGAGQSKTLAIISLVLGGIALLSVLPMLIFVPCGVLPILFGIGAVITGFLARGRANKSPDQYGGVGLALGGLIAGGLSILATIGVVILTLVFVGAALSR